jgi:hypothetical protein
VGNPRHSTNKVVNGLQILWKMIQIETTFCRDGNIATAGWFKTWATYFLINGSSIFWLVSRHSKSRKTTSYACFLLYTTQLELYRARHFCKDVNCAQYLTLASKGSLNKRFHLVIKLYVFFDFCKRLNFAPCYSLYFISKIKI